MTLPYPLEVESTTPTPPGPPHRFPLETAIQQVIVPNADNHTLRVMGKELLVSRNAPLDDVADAFRSQLRRRVLSRRPNLTTETWATLECVGHMSLEGHAAANQDALDALLAAVDGL